MCEKALCVVSNELVLVSVWQGVYLQAFGELMKDFPCCPTAKKKQESRKADTRRARRGPASSGVLREEHALHNQRKHFTFPWLESPGPPCPGEHPSAQTSLGSLHTPCRRSPSQVTRGQGDPALVSQLVPRMFPLGLFPTKEKGLLSPSSL